MLFLAALGYNLVNKSNNLLIDLMSHIDCLNHSGLGNLICSGLDHDYFFSGGRHGQLKVGYLILALARIDNKFSVDHSDLGHGAGSGKRNVGNGRCNGGTQHSGQLGAAGGIYGKHQVVQGYVVAVILGEQGAHGAFDYAGG